jgi:hypothetical protein
VERPTNAEFRLTVTIKGDLAQAGRIALSELARIAGELQANLERIAVGMRVPGREPKQGRRPAEVVEAVRLDLVTMRAGSAILELAPHSLEQLQLYDQRTELEAAFQAFTSGVRQLVDDPNSTPTGFDHAVITGLVELAGGVGDGVSEIVIEGSNLPRLVVDGVVKRAARAARRRYVSEVRRLIGRLEMGDFAPSALRCRIDAVDGSYLCDFDATLRDQVLAAMDRVVQVEGAAETLPESGRIRVLHLERIEIIDEQRDVDIDELIRQQGVTPIEGADQLAGARIDDFDEFLVALRSLRETA